MTDWLELLLAFYLGGGLASAVLCYTSYAYAGDFDKKETIELVLFFVVSFVFWPWLMIEFTYRSKDRHDTDKNGP